MLPTKNILFLFLNFCAIIANSQIPDYFGSNPRWHVGDWELDEFGLHQFENCILISGDSIIGSYTYKVFRIEQECNSTPEPTIIGLYRQEGRKIYRYWYNTDSLFISYDLNIGDTLDSYHPDANIDHIDSILVGSEYRRVFLIDTANNQKILIEGIGTRNLHSACPGFWFSLRYYDTGYSWHGYELYTYSENDTVLYGMNVCSALSIETNESKKITLYPIPATNSITIQTGTKEMRLIEILDINGRTIKTESSVGTESVLNISFLENGIYFVRVTYQNGECAVARLVKQ